MTKTLHRLLTTVLAAAITTTLAHAQDDPLAGLDPGKRKVVESFLNKQAGDGQSVGADQVRLVDLDGDGQDELVLVWNLYFGNSQSSSLSVLQARQKQGKRAWHEAATAEIVGSEPRLNITGSQLAVDTKVPGPKDPRCCPTRAKHSEWTFQAGKLLPR